MANVEMIRGGCLAAVKTMAAMEYTVANYFDAATHRGNGCNYHHTPRDEMIHLINSGEANF